MVAVLLAAGGTAAFLPLGDDSGDLKADLTPDRMGGASVVGGPGPTAVNPPASGARPSLPCPGATSSAPNPQPPPSTDPVLAAGYEIREHADGFRGAVPVGWKQTRDNAGRTTSESPDGTARLVVDVLPGNGDDPMTEQRNSAADTVAAYAKYEEIALVEGTRDGGPEATWEYTYSPAEGGIRHITDVRRRVGTTSHNLWIAAPDGPAWPRFEQQLAIALDHFHDTRRG